MGYEETVKEILSTLNNTSSEGADPMSAVWIDKYQADVRFLLKELADTRGRSRELNKKIDSLTNDSKILQDRMVQAIKILSGEEPLGVNSEPNT